jgi:hypothetical protein
MMAGLPPQQGPSMQGAPGPMGQVDPTQQPQFQPPSPEALDFVHKLLSAAHPKHSVHVTHVSIHPAHKAKHGALMKGHKRGK